MTGGKDRDDWRKMTGHDTRSTHQRAYKAKGYQSTEDRS